MLFPRPQQPQDQLLQMIRGNPQGMYQHLLSTNPQFAQFVNANRGKTPEQIAADYGIDYASVRNLLGR